MARQFGIDEAGKGPVLGSMFAACVVADPTTLPDDVRDSKRLTPQRREELARDVRRVAHAVGVAEITVAEIDDPEVDMNTLTVDAHANAILDAGSGAVAGTPGMADAGDTSEERFATRVARRIPHELDLTAEHRADDTYAIVAAASIIAKVARDAHVDRLADGYAEDYGDIGSGYASDPSTQTFLEAYVAAHGDLPECARRSWQTSKRALADAEQSGLEDYF